MRKALLNGLFALFALATTAVAHADYIEWASGLGPLGIRRGDPSIGPMPGFYGGAFPGVFPVPLTDAEAAAAALGAPDGRFVSLPGNEAADPTPSGTGFRWAFVDLLFSSPFDATSDLVIHELGNNAESVHLFLWFTGGGNLQLWTTRGAGEPLIVDLAPYAALAASYGGFSGQITLGGLDLLGGSPGFDLDAVGITRVPEPGTLALLAAALIGAGAVRRRAHSAQA
jgi:hypothetical protein